MTLLNMTRAEVPTIIQGKDYEQNPTPIKRDIGKQNQKKYYLFHKDKDHDTKKCFALKKEIKRLITKSYL